MFPRIGDIFDNRKEISLSCNCLKAFEIISNINSKIKIISEDSNKYESNLLELKVRDALINIIWQENLNLEYKLLIRFEMLLTVLENEILNLEIIK